MVEGNKTRKSQPLGKKYNSFPSSIHKDKIRKEEFSTGINFDVSLS